MMPPAASRADTRPCRLPRMAPASCGSAHTASTGFQPLADLRVLGVRTGATRTAVEQTLAISLNEFKSLPSRKRPRAHAFHRQEFVGRLADPLRQHHQLPRGRDFRRRRVLLQASAMEIVSRFQQVGGLAVDGAQSLPTWVRIFCWLITTLAFFSARSTIGTILSRSSAVRPERLQAHRFVATAQPTQGLGQRLGAFLHSGKAWRCPPAPATRIGKTLRLHQRLAVPATCWATLSARATAKRRP